MVDQLADYALFFLSKRLSQLGLELVLQFFDQLLFHLIQLGSQLSDDLALQIVEQCGELLVVLATGALIGDVLFRATGRWR